MSIAHWGSMVRWICAVVLTAVLMTAGAQAADKDDDVWGDLRSDLFGDSAVIAEEDGMVKLEAPYRAEDAAIVPITVTIPASIAPKVSKLTLLVEKNPAPVVGTFTFGSAAGYGDRKISTRIRINEYSNVRAIIETEDGKLHMTTKFVKGAGGCSAPALKDMETAMRELGKMKLKPSVGHANTSTPMREGQVMIRHPNNSGLQVNHYTGLFIPAKFVNSIDIRKGNEVVFKLVGGISFSENPHLQFTYASGVEGPLTVTAKDTDGKEFTISESNADT